MLEDQFEDMIDRIPFSGCWIWLGALSGKGYGRAWFNGRSVRAHRLSYELYRGTIPVDLMVLHSCDVPSCVNPGHLYLGDNQQNMWDRTDRGRVVPSAQLYSACKRGHLLSGNNLYIWNNKRYCRTCQNSWRKYQAQINEPRA